MSVIRFNVGAAAGAPSCPAGEFSAPRCIDGVGDARRVKPRLHRPAWNGHEAPATSTRDPGAPLLRCQRGAGPLKQLR
ncbi:hypothetical protein ACFFTM_22880 [Pseudoduganella plicata]